MVNVQRAGAQDVPYLIRAFSKVVEINYPLVLSLSKDGCRWFDKLTMSGGRRTLKGPCGITVAIIAVALTMGGIRRLSDLLARI